MAAHPVDHENIGFVCEGMHTSVTISGNADRRPKIGQISVICIEGDHVLIYIAFRECSREAVEIAASEGTHVHHAVRSLIDRPSFGPVVFRLPHMQISLGIVFEH